MEQNNVLCIIVFNSRTKTNKTSDMVYRDSVRKYLDDASEMSNV